MNPLRGMMWLLIFQSAGELLARGLALPLPGPVIGMVLLLLALRCPAVRRPVAACVHLLLMHLSYHAVPLGVCALFDPPILQPCLSMIHTVTCRRGVGCA